MTAHVRSSAALAAMLAWFACSTWDVEYAAAADARFHAALLNAADVTERRIQQLDAAGATAIAVIVEAGAQDVQAAAERIRQSSLSLYYWIEVARCPALANAHPEWMASLQGHSQWRRLFPEAPHPAANEVVKTYPWVPILSRETFAAQLQRVRRLLVELPQPDGLFLNDLQGAPSACGCGNSLCRWTSDYGKRRTTSPLGDDAAARFVAAVGEALPGADVIPVWTTECEQHDGAADGLCAGVGCFDGICWRAFTAQLAPLERQCRQLAVLTLYREFQRDLPIYGPQAGWIRHALESFATMPRRHDRTAVETSRLIAVVQGWDADAPEIATQIKVAIDAGAAGCVVAYARLDQGWAPKIVK